MATRRHDGPPRAASSCKTSIKCSCYITHILVLLSRARVRLTEPMARVNEHAENPDADLLLHATAVLNFC